MVGGIGRFPEFREQKLKAFDGLFLAAIQEYPASQIGKIAWACRWTAASTIPKPASLTTVLNVFRNAIIEVFKGTLPEKELPKVNKKQG